jgi:putative transposase
MFRISKDSPAFYLTSVAKDRLPVFRTRAIKEIVCKALNEARQSAGFLLFAYVLMPDHLHTIVGSELKPSKVLQYINGIISRRVIQFLKDNGHTNSLEKLRHLDKGRNYKHSLWDHHPNGKLISSEEVFMQKVRYVHQNPVRAGLVSDPLEYRWSSARCWAKKDREDEPVFVDIGKILWRQRR